MSDLTQPPTEPHPPIYDTETFSALTRARKRKQWQLYLNAILIIGIASLGVALLLLNNHSGRQDAAIQQLSSSLSTTCGQTNKGTLPVNVRQACALAQSGQAPQIVSGKDGVNGTNGVNGVNGTNGTNGSSPPCLLTASQCVGATGSPGVSGKNGTNGVNGINGTNGANAVTPPCLMTASQCVGASGANGANGSPATTEVFVYPDGSQQTCVRNSGSPDTTPAYTCSQTTTPSGAVTTSVPAAPSTVVAP